MSLFNPPSETGYNVPDATRQTVSLTKAQQQQARLQGDFTPDDYSRLAKELQKRIGPEEQGCLAISINAVTCRRLITLLRRASDNATLNERGE